MTISALTESSAAYRADKAAGGTFFARRRRQADINTTEVRNPLVPRQRLALSRGGGRASAGKK